MPTLTPLNMWVDDLRPPPDHTGDRWYWAKTSEDAIHTLKYYFVGRLSLDHDLGPRDTAQRIVDWMAEHAVWPAQINIHTANPVGRANMQRTIERYAPAGTLRR